MGYLTLPPLPKNRASTASHPRHCIQDAEADQKAAVVVGSEVVGPATGIPWLQRADDVLPIIQVVHRVPLVDGGAIRGHFSHQITQHLLLAFTGDEPTLSALALPWGELLPKKHHRVAVRQSAEAFDRGVAVFPHQLAVPRELLDAIRRRRTREPSRAGNRRRAQQ